MIVTEGHGVYLEHHNDTINGGKSGCFRTNRYIL